MVTSVIAAALLAAVAQEPGRGPEAKASFEKRSYPFEGEVAADRLNVRMFPKNDQTGIITSVLSLGEKVTVVSETGDYYQILPPKGSTAWVVSRNVKREGEAGTVLGSDVPVRLDSRVNADQVATLKQGEAVRIVGENMGWFKIEAPAAVKYFVGKKFVRQGKELDPSLLTKDEPKKAAAGGKVDGDAKARALLAMADEELKAQVKLLDERRVTEFDLTRTVDLFENAKTEATTPAVRSEADRGLAHAGTVHKLWATTKEEIKKKEAEVAAAKAAVAAEKVVEESRPTMAGHIDTTGLLWKRPGTHKLVMGGKTVCFLRVKDADEKMISRLNDHYGRYVGVKGTVIKNPEGWDGYSVVVVEEIIPLTNPQ
ncbi:MAG TPA: SH3 domain-containing protein [Planctomycetota bacterium]